MGGLGTAALEFLLRFVQVRTVPSDSNQEEYLIPFVADFLMFLNFVPR